MKLGLDFYGTVENYPKQYAKWAQSVLDFGGKVYIVTAVAAHNEREVRKAIRKSHVPCTEIYVLTYTEHFEVPKLKVNLALALGIDLFVDDRADTVNAMRVNGILGLLA